MWIFCCGMIRSGSTLQYQLTKRIVEESRLGKGLGWIKIHNFSDLRSQYSKYPGFKVIKSHILTDDIKKEFYTGYAKGIYVYRDIRDVIASLMRKESKSLREILNNKVIENTIQTYYKWINLPGILISRYEEMIKDLKKEVIRIADHLSIKLDDKKYEEISDDYTIAKQKKRINDLKGEKHNYSQNNKRYFDPDSLLHTNHITSESSQKWISFFTREEILQIEKRSKNWLMKNNYQIYGE